MDDHITPVRGDRKTLQARLIFDGTATNLHNPKRKSKTGLNSHLVLPKDLEGTSPNVAKTD
jgi:hypothetical protein